MEGRAADDPTRPDGRWNHNLAYHGLVLDVLGGAAGAGVGRVLDVGCGEGTLARQLADRADEVIGIDLDEPSIDLARRATTADNVTFLLGDVLTEPLAAASFDGVVSIATVHHLDLATALARLAELTAPGGTVVVIGLARSRGPRDLGFDAAGTVASRIVRMRRGWWNHPSPTVWPPPTTYAEVQAISAEVLPGRRYRRHLYFRYSLVWQKPTA